MSYTTKTATTDKRHVIHVSLSAEVFHEVERLAKEECRTKSGTVTVALLKYLQQTTQKLTQKPGAMTSVPHSSPN